MKKTEARGGTIFFGAENDMETQLKLFGVNDADLKALRLEAGKDHKVYKAYMSILILGFSCIDQEVPADSDHDKDETSQVYITPKFYNDFCNSKHGILKKIGIRDRMKALSPAGRKGELLDLSGLGFLVKAINALTITSPVETTQQMANGELENALRAYHNKYIDSIVDFGNALKTKAWLEAIPNLKAGSLAQIMNGITGMVKSFQQAVQDIYKGIKDAIIIAKLWINQQILALQKFIVNKFLKGNLQMILYAFCFIFSCIQSLLDDLAFFGQLFNASDSFFKMFNILQTVVNWGSQIITYIYNPITALLPALFPKEVGAFFDYINKLDKIPEMFTNFIAKYTSFNKQFNSTAIATINTIVKRYKLGAKLGPLEPVVDSFGTVNLNNSKWQRSTAPVFQGPIELKPLAYSDPRSRWTGSSLWELAADGSSVLHNLTEDFANFQKSGQKMWSGIQQSSQSLWETSKSVFKDAPKDSEAKQKENKDSN
jgi:hypothetical protein